MLFSVALQSFVQTSSLSSMPVPGGCFITKYREEKSFQVIVSHRVQ